jgi:hypothetical protein
MMRKKIIAAIMFCTTIISANEPISPFGGIEWTDSFVEVVKKINSMKPNVITFGISEQVDIKGIVDKKNLSKKVGISFEKEYPTLFDPERAARQSWALTTYKDLNGKEKKYNAKQYTIFASPIIISGVPFELEAKFKTNSGLAVRNPEAVLSENKMGYTFPLVLKEVILRSKSPSLVDKAKNINDIIETKYKKYLNPEMSNKVLLGQQGGAVGDSQGNIVRISPRTNNYVISYESEFYFDELSEEYRKHLSNLESGKFKSKQDMSSGL